MQSETPPFQFAGRVSRAQGIAVKYPEFQKLGAEAKPSGQRPGKKTLQPGAELVGNVWKEWKMEMAFDQLFKTTFFRGACQ
jgi:hypothetical protein